MKRIHFIVLLLAITCIPHAGIAKHTFKVDTVLMGVSFSFTAVHVNPYIAEEAVRKGVDEVIRIEKLISSWDPDSQTSAINAQAGIAPIKVDDELFQLIQRANKISEISNGYFDISFASIHKVWDFENFDQDEIPTDEAIVKSVSLIDYRKISLDDSASTVFLTDKGMRIGFGAIGKGYAADRAKALMVEMGIEDGVINAGGDLISWGYRPDSTPWKVGISDPSNKSKIIAWLESEDMAIVTSGNYKKYLVIDGKRYCHIIDPKSGWPVEELSSVTIMTQDAELADALATTVFVLGKLEGLKLVDHLNGVESMIVDADGNMYFSQNMKRPELISND